MLTGTNADDHEGCAAEFRRVANSLDDRALRVNGITPTEAILTDCNDLAPLKEDRNVVAGHMFGRITSALRENITVNMLLNPRGEHVRGVDLLIEGHPDRSLQRDVLRGGGMTGDAVVKFCVGWARLKCRHSTIASLRTRNTWEKSAEIPLLNA